LLYQIAQMPVIVAEQFVEHGQPRNVRPVQQIGYLGGRSQEILFRAFERAVERGHA
jgi:hypothetical protein